MNITNACPRSGFGLNAAGRIAAAASLLASLAACVTSQQTMPMPAMPTAVAQLQAKSSSNVGGSVAFSQEGERVRVVAHVTGLKPGQEHGFHVHEKGDCSSPDAMSAGGHFNPGSHPHGPQSSPHHGGDMPSLRADAKGTADVSFLIDGVVLGTGGADLMGKAVVVHAMPDDYKTQPTGNSGGRIACGVIANPA
ncbi:N/A [soil metagenome]